jgi:hypothetical protein
MAAFDFSAAQAAASMAEGQQASVPIQSLLMQIDADAVCLVRTQFRQIIFRFGPPQPEGEGVTPPRDEGYPGQHQAPVMHHPLPTEGIRLLPLRQSRAAREKSLRQQGAEKY